MFIFPVNMDSNIVVHLDLDRLSSPLVIGSLRMDVNARSKADLYLYCQNYFQHFQFCDFTLEVQNAQTHISLLIYNTMFIFNLRLTFLLTVHPLHLDVVKLRN